MTLESIKRIYGQACMNRGIEFHAGIDPSGNNYAVVGDTLCYSMTDIDNVLESLPRKDLIK